MVLAVIRRRGNAYELRFFDGRRLGPPIAAVLAELVAELVRALVALTVALLAPRSSPDACDTASGP